MDSGEDLAVEPVRVSEIVDIAAYEKIRPDFRSMVLEAKEPRRIGVGPDFSFLFENRLTVRYQIQEMMRTERIVLDGAIAHELRTYNELIPPPGSLSATLLLEYDEPTVRDHQLRQLIGIENHVKLLVGGLPPVPAVFDTRQMNDQRVSAVQYLQFHLTESHRRSWDEEGGRGKVGLSVDHAHYSFQTILSPSSIRALAEDLAG